MVMTESRFKTSSITVDCTLWQAQYQVQAGLVFGKLYYDGEFRKNFTVKLEPKGRFKISYGRGGYKMVFIHVE